MPLVDPVALQQTPMKQIERVTKKLKQEEDLEPAIGRALTNAKSRHVIPLLCARRSAASAAAPSSHA